MFKKIVMFILIFGLNTQSYGLGDFFKVFSEAKSSVIETFLERFLIKSLAEEKQEKTPISNENYKRNQEAFSNALYHEFEKSMENDLIINEEKCMNVLFDTYPKYMHIINELDVKNGFKDLYVIMTDLIQTGLQETDLTETESNILHNAHNVLFSAQSGIDEVIAVFNDLIKIDIKFHNEVLMFYQTINRCAYLKPLLNMCLKNGMFKNIFGE